MHIPKIGHKFIRSPFTPVDIRRTLMEVCALATWTYFILIWRSNWYWTIITLLHFRSDEYEAAQLSLLKSFDDSFQRYRIPCYMAFGEKRNDSPLEFRYLLPDFLILRIANQIFITLIEFYRAPQDYFSFEILNDHFQNVLLCKDSIAAKLQFRFCSKIPTIPTRICLQCQFRERFA